MPLKYIKSKVSLDRQSKILFKNSSWNFVAYVVGFVLAFLRSVVLARGLGVEIFGIYNIIINFITTILSLCDLNIGTAIIKFGAGFKNERRIDKLMSLVKGCVLASLTATLIAIVIIVLILFLWYDSLFNLPGLEWFVSLYAVATAISFFSHYLSHSLLRLYFKFKINAVISMAMDVVEFGLILIAILMYPNNLTVFFIVLLLSKLFNGIVCTIATFWEIRKDIGNLFEGNTKILGSQWSEIRGFIAANSLSASVKTLINKGDVLLLGFVGTPAMVSFYSIAKKLAYSVLSLTDPLQESIYPQLSKLIAEKKYAETQKMLIKISKLLIYPSIVIMAFIYFFRVWIITTIFGQDYAPAGAPFFFLMVSAMLLAVFFWNLSMLQSLGLVKFRLAIYIIALIVGGGVAYSLIPTLGASGAAIGLLASWIIVTFAFVFACFKKLQTLQKEQHLQVII